MTGVDAARVDVTTVELLRHAKARSRRSWSPRPDRERPLDAKGRAQAKWLAAHLSEADPVRAIVTSPSVRCRETVEPLAQSADCEVHDDHRLADLRRVPVTDQGSAWVSAAWLGGRSVAAISDAVARPAHGRIVVCSHGDVIAAILGVLAGRDDLALADAAVRKGAWVTLRFGPDGRCLAATPHDPAPMR